MLAPAMDAANVSVIGGGAWGLALARAAARAGSKVAVVTRRAQPLPEGIERLEALRDAARHARLVVLAVPSTTAAKIARELGDALDGSHYVVHGVRGLVGSELSTVSEIVTRETPARRVGALGGPALAAELHDGTPGVLVAGSRFPEVTERVIERFRSDALRIYPTRDLLGLEWASALVGCLGIGVSYARGLGMSAGIVSALTTRAVSEAARILRAAGGEERTMFGLAGYGDLLASVTQGERPEVVVGRALAAGKTLEQAQAEAELRVEALELVPRIVVWCRERKVAAPIFSALATRVLEQHDPAALMRDLMTMPVEDEG